MIAFVNVNVIPMDSEQVLENQTVIVEGDRITVIGAADKVNLPADAIIITAQGGYLMPGLADMHMHIESLTHTFEGPAQLWHYLAAGVTTIRNLSALPKHLVWEREITRGERVGPNLINGRMVVGLPDELSSYRLAFRAIIIFSPVVIGLLLWLMLWLMQNILTSNQGLFQHVQPYLWPSLGVLFALGVCAAWLKIIPLNAFTSRFLPFATISETGAEARRFVREIKSAGFDFVKPYDYLPEDAYLAVLQEARELNLYSVGHLLDELAPELEKIFQAGLREVAHIDELTDAHLVGHASPNAGFKERSLDYTTIPQTTSSIKAHDVIVVSNLVADEVIYRLLEDPDLLSDPIYTIVPPDVLDRWRSRGRVTNWQGQQRWRRSVQMPFLMTMAKALHDAGVPLLIGTDMTVEGMVPGHLHRDLELLVEAGLTPFQALEAGTKNAAMSVGRMGGDGSFGTIAVGQRADLLLLKANPLENISNTRSRVGVMVCGQWFTQVELDAQAARVGAPGAGNRK